MHQAREPPLNAWTKRWPKGHARNPTLHLDKGGGCGAPRTPLSTEERPTPEKEGSPPRQTGRIGATSSMHPGCPKHAVGALCTPKAFCTHEVARLVASETKAHRGDYPCTHVANRARRTRARTKVHTPGKTERAARPEASCTHGGAHQGAHPGQSGHVRAPRRVGHQ